MDAVDLVVVGGGITGAGIARDAALRGLRVALFEKGDYGSGTSSKSSKLIHGGLRYLRQGEIWLVFESVSERAVQSKLAPHLVQPMPFLVPIYKQSRPGLEVVNIGLWIYDTLAMFRAPRLHKTFRGAKAHALEPALTSESLTGIIEYYDYMTDDARLVLENILDARAHDAACYSYTEVIGLEREPADTVDAGQGRQNGQGGNGGQGGNSDQGGNGGRVTAVRVRDVLTGAEKVVRTRMVVIAAGPWTDEVAHKLGIATGRKLLRCTKGVHLVFPREKLPLARSVTLMSPVDGRVMFAIPWRDRTVIGTTDTDFDGKADEVYADHDDARYLCDSANRYFPQANLRPEDVIATWAGLRPLIQDPDAESESAVSREHEIFVRDDGILIIAGGKLTTYRLMAKAAVKRALKWLRKHDREALAERQPMAKPGTKKRPLPGAQGLDDRTLAGVDALGQELASARGLDQDVARHLARVYGTRAAMLADMIDADPALGAKMQPDLPHVWAEVAFAAQHDLARTIADVLARRVPLLLIARDQGLDVIERVGDIMAGVHGWDAAERSRQLEHYRQAVADSRRFRT